MDKDSEQKTLKSEDQTGAEAALILSEDQQGAITQQEGAIALGQQVARVQHAINSGDKADQRRKIAELMDVIGLADR